MRATATRSRHNDTQADTHPKKNPVYPARPHLKTASGFWHCSHKTLQGAPQKDRPYCDNQDTLFFPVRATDHVGTHKKFRDKVQEGRTVLCPVLPLHRADHQNRQKLLPFRQGASPADDVHIVSRQAQNFVTGII